ncbi:MAG: prenyltransferase [Candidatus Aminicenantes bacterium]|nr:prenyltransferase [Candidatus Aminicenantes bacterium]
MSIKKLCAIWFMQIRGPFLILSVALVLLGVATAYWHGFVHIWHSLLLTAGVTFAHVAVNLFNEIADFRSKIDEHTIRTPFSGGSGMLQSGRTTIAAVTWMANLALLAAGSIGFYFCLVSGWPIIFFMIGGALAIRFYTTHLAKWLIGELVSGLTLGSFVVIGSHYALTSFMTLDIIYISLVPGILTALLLFLNEFPDLEADRQGGRRHLVIFFGTRKSAVIYAAAIFLLFVLIAAGPFIQNVPYTVLIALASLPLGILAAIQVFQHHDEPARLVYAQGLNVALVILTDLLLAVAYFI